MRNAACYEKILREKTNVTILINYTNKMQGLNVTKVYIRIHMNDITR